MGRISIENGQAALSVREALNSNFAELYGWDGNSSAFSPIDVPVGSFIGNARVGATLGTAAGVANQIVGAPISFNRDTQVDQLGVSVSTLVASANVRVLIFATDAQGRPTDLLLETANISAAATGTVFATLGAPFTFLAGVTYIVAVHSSSTATLRTVPSTALGVLSWTSAATPAQNTAMVKTATFGSPGNWGAFSAAQLQTTAMPLVLMRRAA